jgi:hypothetical protein
MLFKDCDSKPKINKAYVKMQVSFVNKAPGH